MNISLIQILSSERNRYLEIADSGFLLFEQSIKLKIWFIFVEEHHLRINILPGGGVEVCQEVGHTDIRDIATHNDELFVIRGSVGSTVLVTL